ncbi:hypothetical protein V495_04306 [Pseudogymnoascus sp. VKM F-4514 (FW-929)]|nr:hypothetical protein V490_02728 [Pseudogymnoascus sp. VKM F-3557]KFY42872.1 hypothetical protein V495_04306 [Pseudogymnoascus sp. VKM F-4514 (FW-929)]KFY55980.1 hypothetical protein V497_06594 [Pseudogymnoascus sp. VKM F-4516 (FW-969)]
MGPQSEGGPPGPSWAYGGPPPSGEDNRYQSSRDMGPSGYPQQQQQSQQQQLQQQQNLPRQIQNNGFDQANRGPPPPSMQVGNPRKDNLGGDAHKDSSERDRSRHRGGKRTGSGQLRLCKKCGEPLTGQFVRALGGTFHLDCFKCKDCGQIVASKFFPVDDESGQGQYPLCETDYFRRLGLLCHQCGGALRGSYITALERKYHIDHFTCSVCPTVFGAQDSYYEHDDKVYCHYHYSTQFAQRCNGCQTAILKQFVEIFRNGQNQHWHPECYMIHKFWNVRLAEASSEPPPERPLLKDASDVEARNLVRDEEERMEEKVYRIWSVLSTFEESSAANISDMLLHVSNGAYVDGVLTAKKFIWHVDLLFKSADKLDAVISQQGVKGLSYSREAKLLCKKIVAFFALLSKTQETGVRKLGVTQELLSLVTGLAHYLKLLIRICLQGALRVEREMKNTHGLDLFLGDLGDVDQVRDDEKSLEETTGTTGLAGAASDQCTQCQRPIEDECAIMGEKRWHLACLSCSTCSRDLSHNLEDVRWSDSDRVLYCNNCQNQSPDSVSGFTHVTRLQQYVFLLRVALARLLVMLRNSGTLPHTSDDPNLNGYNSQEGHRVGESSEQHPAALTQDSRSKSYGGTSEENPRESSYENTLNDVRRLRSTRMDKHLSSTIKKARTSRIMDGPESRSVRPGSAGADGSDTRNADFHIVEERDNQGEPRSELLFGHQDALTLDDIPRIVAAEQAKEQRPNAYKHARHELFKTSITEPKLLNGHQRTYSNANELDNPNLESEPSPQRGPPGKRYFSELSALEYFIVRHVAVLSMQPLLDGHFTLEELLGLIESRKPTFWDKFGKAFKNDGRKGAKKKGVFGVPLEAIIERDGADSTDGVGPGSLRIPALVDDAISTMRKMDLSVEGVFRKNGNIKRLNEAVAAIDKDGCDAVDLSSENVVQVAALLKKYLRELPDPLLTFKLHRLYITSQKIADEDKRRRVLHLTCCLLPKAHRDCLEILCSFLNWTASFHQVDEESGSKMDTHNLATVIAPNILFTNTKNAGMDDSFLAIEAVHSLIEFNDQMCEVPEDLQSILNDSSLFNNSGDITTKEILKRYGDIAASGGPRHQVETTQGPARSNDGSGRAHAPVVTRVETENSQNGTWQNETSVRHVQEPSVNFGGSGSQTTPPQQPWQGDDFEHPSPYSQRDGSGSGYPSREKLPFVQRDGNGTPDSHKEGSSSGGGNRGWRHSAWGSRSQQQQQNGSLGVTGTS